MRIAQAASSENGTAFGTPPNQLRTQGQLDGELNVIPFYSSNWLAVFRAKDMRIGNKIGDLAYNIVAAGDKVGYGQQTEGAYARTGLFDALNQMTVPDPAKIKTPVNCDCSSMSGACAYFAGAYYPDFRTMNTTTAPSRLMASGYFDRLEDRDLLETGRGCRRGDIYWRYGHMMVCLETDGEQITEPRMIWNCSACNMRSGAGTEYKILRTLHPNDIVSLISTAENGWKQVEIGGLYGFVSPKYVIELPKARATGNVWMRSGAGTQYDQIIVIPYGASVWWTGETKKVGLTTWYEVIYSNRRGFASGKYISPKS